MTDSEKKTEEFAEEVKRRIIAEAHHGRLDNIIVTINYYQHGITDIRYNLGEKVQVKKSA